MIFAVTISSNKAAMTVHRMITMILCESDNLAPVALMDKSRILAGSTTLSHRWYLQLVPGIWFFPLDWVEMR